MTNQDKADRIRQIVVEAATLEKELNEEGFKVICSLFGDYRHGMTFKNQAPIRIIKQVTVLETL